MGKFPTDLRTPKQLAEILGFAHARTVVAHAKKRGWTNYGVGRPRYSESEVLEDVKNHNAPPEKFPRVSDGCKAAWERLRKKGFRLPEAP